MTLFFTQSQRDSSPAIASVSYSDENSFGALWDGQHRGIVPFAPRGIAYKPCEGDQLLIMDVKGTSVCLGVKNGTSNLKPGELMLTSSGGAKICLKADGSISLNGLIISKSGVIQ